MSDDSLLDINKPTAAEEEAEMKQLLNHARAIFAIMLGVAPMPTEMLQLLQALNIVALNRMAKPGNALKLLDLMYNNIKEAHPDNN